MKNPTAPNIIGLCVRCQCDGFHSWLTHSGMHGYLNIEDCGKPDTITRILTYRESRMIKNWNYFIAAEEIVWDYAEDISDNVDKQYKTQYLENFSNHIGKKYKKAVFRQYKDATFTKPVDNIRNKELGILGPVIRAQVRDTINIVFKNMASRPYSIYVHGVTLSKEAEGAVYPSDSKENITLGKAVPPGEVYTYKWTVRDTDVPTAEDAQCVTRLYHSAVDITKDIASGLIGPLLVCKPKALDTRGVQNKADTEQHAVFAVFDENKSWYLEDNIKEYCSSPSTVKRDNPRFQKSNVMYTLNGYACDRTDILGFCEATVVEWHLASIGTQDKIVPVHLSGHTFLSRGKHQDILDLFPMDGRSASVTMDNIGTWLLSSWGSREMSYGMRLRFRNAKCSEYKSEEEDYDYDNISANVVQYSPETEKGKEKKHKSAMSEELLPQGENADTMTEEDEEQEMLASMLGLRTFKQPLAPEEEVNLTAIAFQNDTSGSSSTNDTGTSGSSHLVFTNHSDILLSDKVLDIQNTTPYPNAVESLHPTYTSFAGEILLSDFPGSVSPLSSEQGQSDHEVNATQTSETYSQTLQATHLRMDKGVHNEDAELLVDGENSSKLTFAVTSSVKKQEESAVEMDGKSEKQVLTLAVLHALKEMQALLLYVQQKRNLSALDNVTSYSPFLAVPTAENDNLYDIDYDNFSYSYEVDKEKANTESPIPSTNLTLAVGETMKNHSSEPLQTHKLELSNVQQYGNLSLDSVLDSFISTVSPKTAKSLKNSPHQKQKCTPRRKDYKLNVASGKKNYNSQTDLMKNADNKFQNSSSNSTEPLEKATILNKEGSAKNGSYVELDQPEKSNKYGKGNERCAVRSFGTFLTARRKKKNPGNFLGPRSSKSVVPPGQLNNTQSSIKANHTVLKEATYTVAQNQFKPMVRIGLPVGNGDYHEYEIDDTDYEQSSSGSFEYLKVRYDDPYSMDPRLDTQSMRNPEAIAGRYLRTANTGNLRRYFIAAEEVLWDYVPSTKSTKKSASARTVYKKAIFRSYVDGTFKTPVSRGEYEEHLGILGPVIRAEEADVIQASARFHQLFPALESAPVYFKNLASRPYSLHAHGLYYEKSSEGRSYDDMSPELFKKDDAIMPNETYTYVWYASKRSGPVQDKRACRSWAYYSAVNAERDINSGLIGPILICQKGMLDEYNMLKNVRAFVLLFMTFNEEKSWYFDEHIKRTHAKKSSIVLQQHKFPAINGIQYQLQGLLMYTDEVVQWHLLNMGGPQDIHVINFHGQTFTEQGMEDHQLGVYPLLSGSFTTVEMTPSKAGVWLLETEVSEYEEAGMQASFTVIDKECRLPLGLANGIIQDSQISASDHIGYWEPKLARLNNAGKYNAWSIEKKNNHPWIQVDLQKQVLITGIQTQGAKQLMRFLYTKEYFVSYSKDGTKWITFKGNYTGAYKPFAGNSDAHGIKENQIDPPIAARYIRVYPTKFFNRATLRMELLGCETEACFVPLGMETGAITNEQITASSFKRTWWSSWKPSLARLNLRGQTNAWQAKSNNQHQWLQIDLLQPKKITGIATQGAKSMTTEMFVKTFSILYSDDGSEWKSYMDDSKSSEKVFTANINSHGQVKNYFKPPIVSGFIRVIPKTWNQSIALRVELFGCDVH
ncbi:Coagulation factor V [Varanus komodoensis]|nr:Coagulation factor V [Varanus komodoensis]